MPLNSPKRPPYWNSTSGFDFDHITAVQISFCTSLRNFIQIGPPSAEKNDVMSIFKMTDLSILDFKVPIMGSLKSPCVTSCRSSIDTIALNYLVFEKIAFYCILATDKQTDNKRTDGQHQCTKSFSFLCSGRRWSFRTAPVTLSEGPFFHTIQQPVLFRATHFSRRKQCKL